MRHSLTSMFPLTASKARGPFKVQPDVFDNPPGTEGYSPLRVLNLISWKEEESAREFKSVADVKTALSGGEVKIKRSGVVVNMPMLTWPGGRR